jgi:hypothetical protein
MKRRTSMWRWLVTVVILGFVVGLFAIIFFRHTGPELVRRYVLDPVPRSVAEVRVDRLGGVFAYGYAFRFKINKADAAAIIMSRPFQEVQNAKYEDWGGLSFEWSPKSGCSLTIYSSEMSRPSWFDLGLWHSPDAYAYEEHATHQTTIYVFLYDRQGGEAYFIFTTQ